MDNIKDAKELISKSSNIVVFTGAGISTNCGIPDFRSEEGIYKILENEKSLPYPEALFDINFFKQNPKPFYRISSKLFTQDSKPSLCHNYLATLEEQDKISLVVTQNIDMLHQKAGTKKIIECHGSYTTAHCLKCSKKYTLIDLKKNFEDGSVPYCDCKGVIKPDIVFFGEQLPKEFLALFKKGPEADLVLILGTSLTVEPAASFALELANRTPSIIVNKTETEYDNIMDYSFRMDLDTFVKEIGFIGVKK